MGDEVRVPSRAPRLGRTEVRRSGGAGSGLQDVVREAIVGLPRPQIAVAVPEASTARRRSLTVSTARPVSSEALTPGSQVACAGHADTKAAAPSTIAKAHDVRRLIVMLER